MTTYKPLSLAFAKGEGIWLTDTEGKQYLDAISGIAVCGLGHGHPKITEAICQQAGALLHTSNLYEIPLQALLAKKLTEIASMDAVFFANSGAEANEAAIKLARLYGHQKGIDLPTIVVMEKAFHGRTLATLTATGNRNVQAGFGPLVSGFIRTPYNDIVALESIANTTSNVVAVMFEPIQGEGGIRIPDNDYLPAVYDICQQNGWLLMLDEIQTGNGRTGQYFAYQHTSVIPDVVTTAKGLGNGVPIGACLARGKAANVFQPGSHGSTFGGNPLACAAALAVVDVIEENDLLSNAAHMGHYLIDKFQKTIGGLDQVVSIRGVGLLLAIELDRPCVVLVSIAQEHGLLINVTAENVIRLLPPLIITEQDADEIVNLLEKSLLQFFHSV